MNSILVGLLCDICELPIAEDDNAVGFTGPSESMAIVMHNLCQAQAIVWAGKQARKEAALAAKEAPDDR